MVHVLAELGARQRDPPLLRAEVHEHGVVFQAQDDAEPVCVVRHLIMDGERLAQAYRRPGIERAAGQVAPGRAAGRCSGVTSPKTSGRTGPWR